MYHRTSRPHQICLNAPSQCYNFHMSIRDHVAIITGAGRGVGKATARRFAREGARVVLFSRTPGPLDETAAGIAHEGGRVLSMVGDVSREEDVRALFRRAVDAY